MKTQLFLCLFLALSFVSAHPHNDEYITVVGEEGGARDVVTAANFAASVGSLAQFTGRLSEDIGETYSEADIENKYFVVIDGRDVLLLGEDEYDYAFEQYFRDQGFSVKTKHEGTIDDLRLYDVEEAPEVDDEVLVGFEPVGTKDPVAEELVAQAKVPKPEPEPFVCMGCEYEGECHALGEVLSLEGIEHECTAEGLVPVEKPSFFSRILSWFTRLF